MEVTYCERCKCVYFMFSIVNDDAVRINGVNKRFQCEFIWMAAFTKTKKKTFRLLLQVIHLFDNWDEVLLMRTEKTNITVWFCPTCASISSCTELEELTKLIYCLLSLAKNFNRNLQLYWSMHTYTSKKMMVISHKMLDCWWKLAPLLLQGSQSLTLDLWLRGQLNHNKKC